MADRTGSILTSDMFAVFSSRQEEITNKLKLLEAIACRECHGHQN